MRRTELQPLLTTVPHKPHDLNRQVGGEVLTPDPNERLMLRLGELEHENLTYAVKILEHPEFRQQAQEGYFTFAMIKPDAHDSKFAEQGIEDDIEAADTIIEDYIEPDFDIVLQFPIYFEHADFDHFYGHIQKFMSPEEYEKTREEFSHKVISALVLQDKEKSNEVGQKWRARMGATNPSKAEPGTIRSNALDIGRNLVHGTSGDPNSEDAELVEEWETNSAKEFSFAASKAKRFLRAHDKSQKRGFPTLNEMISADIIKNKEELVAARKLDKGPEVISIGEEYIIARRTGPEEIEIFNWTRNPGKSKTKHPSSSSAA